MLSNELHDDDLLAIFSWLRIRDKGTCQAVNGRWRRLLQVSLSRETVLSMRLHEESRVWPPCPVSMHLSHECNTIGGRLSFGDLIKLIERTFPQLIALNVYGVNVDFDDLHALSELPFWQMRLVHLEMSYCGLWLNLEKLKSMLMKAPLLTHINFAKSNGISFGDEDVKLMWEQVKHGIKSPKKLPIALTAIDKASPSKKVTNLEL